MEKENKKVRDDVRREYNDTVRSLAKFLRKRDPRHRSYLEQTEKLNQVLPKSNGQPPVHVAEKDLYVEQDWQRIDSHTLDTGLDWSTVQGGHPEEWECLACNKIFRSEAAWLNHERSKKHTKALEALKRDIRRENDELGLPNIISVPNEPTEPSLNVNSSNDSWLPLISHEDQRRCQSPGPGEEEADERPTKPFCYEPESNTHGDHSMRGEGEDGAQLTSKREKRRAREARKNLIAAQQQHQCLACGFSFPSRTQLFVHIRQFGHASRPANTG